MTVARTLFMGWLVLGLVIVHAMPYLHRRRLFGVAVPPELLRNPGGIALIHCYEIHLLPWSLATFVFAMFVPVNASPLWIIAAIGFYGFGTSYAYAQSHTAACRFAVSVGGIRETLLTDSGGDVRRVARYFVPPVVGLAGVSTYVHDRWDAIPIRYPVHWTPNSIPNRFAFKSAITVFGPLLFGALIVLFLAGLCLSILLGSRRRSAASTVIAFLSASAYFVATMFSLVGLLSLHAVPMWLVFLPLIGYFIVLAEDLAPDACWRGGQFYYNPNDPAVFVQTRMGHSYTLNLANRASWFLVGLVVLYLTAMISLARNIWG